MIFNGSGRYGYWYLKMIKYWYFFMKTKYCKMEISKLTVNYRCTLK